MEFKKENILKRKKKAGFTLAEVLITLGVIGVVAAITIPGLMSAYQKHVVETRLKQSYSLLSQVVKLATVDYDDPSGWDTNLNTEDFIRVRVGIGAPENKEDMINYVIGPIPKREKEILEGSIEKAAESVIEILKSGIDVAMNRFN